jgi:hypothetical protein
MEDLQNQKQLQTLLERKIEKREGKLNNISFEFSTIANRMINLASRSR